MLDCNTFVNSFAHQAINLRKLTQLYCKIVILCSINKGIEHSSIPDSYSSSPILKSSFVKVNNVWRS